MFQILSYGERLHQHWIICLYRRRRGDTGEDIRGGGLWLRGWVKYTLFSFGCENGISLSNQISPHLLLIKNQISALPQSHFSFHCRRMRLRTICTTQGIFARFLPDIRVIYVIPYNSRKGYKSLNFGGLRVKQIRPHYAAGSNPVVLPGFEPGQAEPKTAVLPLHHKTILTKRTPRPKSDAKIE